MTEDIRFADFILQAIKANYDNDIREGVTMSSAGYCELKTQKLYINKEKPDIPVDRLLAMLTGTATHDYIFKLLYKYRGEIEGFKYRYREREVVMDTPWGPYRGHLDMAAEVNDTEEVIDLKVVDVGPFVYIKVPRYHDKKQLMLYLAAEGKKNCRLVYICKGGKTTTAKTKEYPFEVDDALVAELVVKFGRIMEGKAEKPFDNPTDSWECGVCPFYEECWGKKTFMQKQDSVAEIPADLEEAFIAIKAKYDQAKADMDAVKENIQEYLGGKRGEGSSMSAWFIGPRTQTTYDSSLLRKYIAEDKLKLCAKTTDKSGYYNMRLKK